MLPVHENAVRALPDAGGSGVIPFMQYLRPNGRRVPVEIDRPAEIEALAQEFIARGGYFECEELSTGHASLTAGHPDAEESDIAIEVVRNGPAVPDAVDRLVRTAHAWRPTE
jgi:hypothetical protein